MEFKSRCVIIQYCAVLGRRETEVRWFKTVLMDSSVALYFQYVGEQTRSCFLIRPDNIRFVQIEVRGRVIWDSR